MNAPTTPDTADITVHRCTVRVIRRGGWSWGGDPRGLLRQVMDSLPELLSERFAEQLAGEGEDVEITEPVLLTVRIGQLAGYGSAVSAAEIVEAVPMAQPMTGATPEQTSDSTVERSLAEEFAADTSWTPRSVAALFEELAERGELAPLLAMLPDESLRVFLAALLTEAGAEAPSRGSTVSDQAHSDLSLLMRSLPLPVAESLKGALVRITRTEAPLREPPETVGSSAGLDGAAKPGASVSGTGVSSATGEIQVWSVLPFLLARPLARIGYLDAIGPALAAAGLAEETSLFAAALAYKVLGVTERAWRRAERDNIAAAAFAGLESVPDLVDFARRARPALPALDGILALSLCRGHDPGQPLLINGVDGGLLLTDAQGIFPIAWAPEVAGLLPHWHACGRPPVLVRDSPLPPGCLRELVSAGVRFATDVRPLRGDPLSRMPWRTSLWATGGVDTRLARDFPGYAGQLDELVQDLFVTRRAVPLAEDGAVERSVTLAAALGLGTIAWTLWRERETPDPVLALTRFADLEATVRFTPDAVRVRIPLGRRHADLLRHGALADVPDVVWLGGRTLTFSGG